MDNKTMKNKNKNKKAIIIFMTVIAFIFVLVLILYFVLFHLSQNKYPSTSGNVFLYNADYDAQIMTEEEYLLKDRTIKYRDGDLTWTIHDEKGTYTADAACLFLIEYINDLVRGDSVSLKQKYTKELREELNIPDRITQQRVYETLLTRVSKTEIVDNNELCFRYEFKIEYKIMRNDGTFRSDLASDSVKAQYFTIMVRDENTEITELVEIAVG